MVLLNRNKNISKMTENSGLCVGFIVYPMTGKEGKMWLWSGGME